MSFSFLSRSFQSNGQVEKKMATTCDRFDYLIPDTAFGSWFQYDIYLAQITEISAALDDQNIAVIKFCTKDFFWNVEIIPWANSPTNKI